LKETTVSHNLAAFLQTLESHETQTLVFDLGGGQRVPSGYHVTEFKALEYHTVDCGGMEHRFQETVIELWNTALEVNRDSLNVGKFLRIYQKVSPQVAFQPHADLIFLYNKPGQPAARYTVSQLEARGQELIVHLEPDSVRCKSAERKADAMLEKLPVVSGCCSASESAASSNLCC
jgi:elongation factor P--beta-lysine ligase